MILAEDAVDAEDVVKHVVEDDQGHVELLFAERTQLFGHKVTQLLRVDGDVRLSEPVREEDGTSKGLP